MKKNIITLLAVAMMLPVSAQRIATKNDIVDCGDILYRKPVTVQFYLTNKSSKRLKIYSVKPDCGCVVVKTPREVSGKKDFIITATYDAKTLGIFEKAIEVKSNASDAPLYLKLRGRVSRDIKDYSDTYPYKMGSIRVNKSELVFDDVNNGDTPTQEIGIINTGGRTYTPTLMHLPSYLTAYASPATLLPGEEGKIMVTLDSKKLHNMGLTQSNVYVSRFSGDKVSDETAISVSAVLLPDLSKWQTGNTDMAPQLKITDKDNTAYSLEHPYIDFGEFGNKSSLKKTIEIVNEGKSTLEISSLQMFTSGMKVVLNKRSIEPGQSTDLKITIDSELITSKVAPRILMITNDPIHPKLTIGIRWK